MFTQDKLLPPGLEITVNLTKNFSDTILLAATTNTDKVVFDKVILRCTFQRPTEMMLNLIEEKLSHDNAVYHADKKILSFHRIRTGAQEFTIDNVFIGTLPYFFIVGIQDRTAFGKSRDKNPYTLYAMKKIQFFLNGQEHFPRPIESTDHDVTLSCLSTSLSLVTILKSLNLSTLVIITPNNEFANILKVLLIPISPIFL